MFAAYYNSKCRNNAPHDKMIRHEEPPGTQRKTSPRLIRCPCKSNYSVISVSSVAILSVLLTHFIMEENY